MNDIANKQASGDLQSAPGCSAATLFRRLDLQGRCTEHSVSWLQFAPPGARWEDAILAEDRAMAPWPVDLTPCELAYRLMTHKGAMEVIDTLEPVLDAQGQPAGWISAVQMAGHLVGRARVVSLVAHELRSPLNAIQSWAHVLESVFDTAHPVGAKAIAGIRKGVASQAAMIDSMSEVLRFMVGHQRVVLGAVSVEQLLCDLAQSCQQRAAERQVELRFAGGESGSFTGDAQRLHQALEQVLDNAIRVSAQGSVVEVRTEVSAGWIRLVVSDAGPGFPEEERKALRDPLLRLASQERRGGGSLGLGLALAARVAALHGGRLMLDNKPGGGAEVSLALPSA